MRACTAIAIASLLSLLCLPAPAPAAEPGGPSAPLADQGESQAEASEAGESQAEDETPGEADEGAEELEQEAEEQEPGSSTGHTRVGHRGRGGHTGRTRRAGGAAAVLSGLALTATARASLRDLEPTAAAIGFSFVLSAPSRVHATLAVRMLDRGRVVWRNVSDSLSASVPKGRARESFSGHNRLAPGLYRLTVTPAGGRPCSIHLTVGR